MAEENNVATENNKEQTVDAAVTTPAKEETKEEQAKEETKEEQQPAAANQQEQQPPKPVPRKANYEKDVVYLFQFSRTPVVPSMSPFCLKVETWLRLAGLKYEVRNCTILYPA
ncbi:hypothetical protein AAG570_004306 [Ranatra chinensis]|uniref:Uncharacterized protein n=1 Tax=Ranatra chinensis TaxID=642074 RepID=A0ABD0Y0S3_9HEMI